MSQKIERTGEISEGELAALKLEHAPWSFHSEHTTERQDVGGVLWAKGADGTLTGPATSGSYSAQWNAGAFTGTHPSPDYHLGPPPIYWHFPRDTTIIIEAEITSYYEVSAPGAYSTDYYAGIFAQRIKFRKLASAGYYFLTVQLIIEESDKIYAARLVAEELPNRARKIDPSVGKGVGDDGSFNPGDELQEYDGSFDGLDGWEPSGIDLLPNGPAVPDGVSPRPTKLSAQWPATQSVASAKAPIPIIYGTHVLGGNYLWLGNPVAEQNDVEIYCVRLLYDIALCCGAVDELISIQVEDKVHACNKVRGVDGTDYVTISLSDHESITFYFGTAAQPVDPTILSEKAVGRYLAYPYICHAVVQISITVKKEETVKVPDIYFMVRRTPSCGLAFSHNIGGAANPVDIIYDLMTAVYFEERFTIDDLDADALLTVGTVLADDEDFGLNLAYRQSMNVTQAIEAVLEHVDASMPFNGEKYVLILNRNDYIVASLPLIDSSNSSRPALKRESSQNVINEVSVSINDEDTDDKSIRLGPARDVGGQETCSYRKPAHLELPGVTNTTLGHRLMWRKLREAVYPSATIEWLSDLDLLTCLPGTKIRATFSELEYTDRVFRLTELKLGEFPLVSMQVAAKEDMWQWTDDSFIELGDLDKWNEGGGEWKKTGTIPVSYLEMTAAGVSYPGIKVFEVPYMAPGAVLDEAVKLAVAVSKPSPYTAIGYFLYVSTGEDKTTDYKLIAVVREFAAQGEVLNAPFHAVMGPHDSEHTLSIAIDGFTMLPYCFHDIKYMHRGQRQDVIDRAQMGWVDGEWVSIRDIIRDDIDLHWRAVGVGRSWLDGENDIEHAVGSEVWILKRGLFLTDKVLGIGDTVYIKAVPFDLFYERDLSECTALAYTVQGVRHRPFSPINLLARSSGRGADRIDAIGSEQSPIWDTGDDVVLYWRNRSRGAGIRFEDFFRVLGDTLAHTDGTEEIDVINPATEVVVRSVTGLNIDTWTYTQGMMAADFGGEPASVKFRVYQKDNAAGVVEALRSLSCAEITVERI